MNLSIKPFGSPSSSASPSQKAAKNLLGKFYDLKPKEKTALMHEAFCKQQPIKTLFPNSYAPVEYFDKYQEKVLLMVGQEIAMSRLTMRPTAACQCFLR
jgi:hypothetical protein